MLDFFVFLGILALLPYAIAGIFLICCMILGLFLSLLNA